MKRRCVNSTVVVGREIETGRRGRHNSAIVEQERRAERRLWQNDLILSPLELDYRLLTFNAVFQELDHLIVRHLPQVRVVYL